MWTCRSPKRICLGLATPISSAAERRLDTRAATTPAGRATAVTSPGPSWLPNAPFPTAYRPRPAKTSRANKAMTMRFSMGGAPFPSCGTCREPYHAGEAPW